MSHRHACPRLPGEGAKALHEAGKQEALPVGDGRGATGLGDGDRRAAGGSGVGD